MLHEKQAKSVIRKMIRKAKQDWTTAIYVIDPYEEENLVEDSSQLERDLLNAVFGVDESHIRFINMTTGQYLGGVHIVLEYDRLPGEIISDYTDNQYTNFLVKHAES